MDRTAVDSRELSSRLKFLHDAAHAMALASPETSSFLESQYSHLLAENDLIPPESRRREVCGACGTILVPGISCTVKQDQDRPSKSRKRGSRVQKAAPSEAGKCCKVKIYSCLRCSSSTRLPIPSSKARMGMPKHAKAPAAEAPPPAARTTTPTADPGAAASAAAPASAPTMAAPAASNANSKKRAKARKGGLQALLANSKKETKPSSGFGLDLMDLMRTD